jgi:anti-sigma factor RsiW
MTAHLSNRAADDHAGHDHQLIVAYACGDLGADEARDAGQLVEQCRRCAALDREIRLMSSLARQLAVPPRPRDFRLSAADAERLRGSAVRRLLRRIGGPGLASLQPLAGAALAIGLLLVVTTAALPLFFAGAGGAAPAAQRELDVGAGGAQGGPESSLAPVAAPTEAPLAPGGDEGKSVIDTTTQATMIEEAPAAPGPDPALLIGAGLVALGGAVLIVRVIARRATEDPLLR